MTEILASKKLSLVCAIINGAMAMFSFSMGDWLWGLVCLTFCVLCTHNYRNTEQQ